MGLLARTCLAASLVFGVALMPAWTEAASKRTSKGRSKKPAARKPVKAKVTAKTIAKWQKKKMPQDQIVEKAMAAGYKVTKLEKKRLLKYKVKKPLIAKLEEAQKAPAPAAMVAEASPNKTPTFDLDKTMDPNEIDFDSVPPPKGMPPEIEKKQAAEKKAAPAPAPAKDENKSKRQVFAAGK
jgi:hypothetical protein